MLKDFQTISPQSYARIAGLLGLLIVVAALFSEGVRFQLTHSEDAGATAKNILSAEPLYRLALAAGLLMLCCDLIYTLILYILLKPVSKFIARLALFFRFTTIAILGTISLTHLAALLFVKQDDYLSVFSSDQRDALALFSLKAHSSGYHIALVFFGFHILCLAYLVVKSIYLPKVIGYGLWLAALCYFINSFSYLLSPSLSSQLGPIILLPALIAETALSLWLLFKGVNIAKWDRLPFSSP